MAKKEVVLVTGSSGYLGGAIIKKLAGKYTVVGFDRPGGNVPPECARQIGLDLGSAGSVDDALEQLRSEFGNRITSVIHLAAYYDISGEPNPLYEKITVQGTRRLVEALQDFEVGQFVFASTMLVHRPTASPYERITEGSPIGPSWPYPESKLRTEALLRQIRGGMPVVFLRIAGVYDDMGHSAFLAEQIAGIYEHRLKAHLYPGMLCAAQSFIHIDDLTEAISRLVERRRELPPELPLLVGEPDVVGYDEIQDIVHQALHQEDWTTVRIPKPVAKAGAWLQEAVLGDESFVKQWMIDEASSHYIVDIDRARRLLGWEPHRSLRETLPKIADALKADPQKWYKANKLNAALVAWQEKEAADTEPKQDGKAAKVGQVAGDRTGMPSDGVSPPQSERDAGDGAMAEGHDHMAMMEADEKKVRWVQYTTIGLGLWLAASVFTYDAMTTANVSDAVRAVTADRGLPSVEWRANALTISDLVSGLLITFFGVLSLSKRTAWWAQWANTFVGLWLFFAPMIFWSPSAAQYLNDTLVGSAVIAFSVLVPMMPGMSMAGMMDPKSIPPGWTYSPSTYAQRLPIAYLGLIGLLISRILTAYQLGHIDSAWEPFFAGSAADPRNGTEEIITSWVSKAWPIPDAGLGAISYLLEILMAVMGTRDRWRTMPWMVTFFGILVIPLGVISIYFIIIQPVLLATWCTLCLLAALAMLIMIPFAIDEVVAMGQFLVWAKRRGRPLIRTFFKGDAVEGGEEDHSDDLASPAVFWADTTRGITLPGGLLVCVALGTFLMLTRLLIGTSGDVANLHHVVGALVITVAVIATAEVARPVRFLIPILAAWLLGRTLMIPTATGLDVAVGAVVALVLTSLSLPRGARSKEHYAGWDAYVR